MSNDITTPTEIARQIVSAYQADDDAGARSLIEQGIALFGRDTMLTVLNLETEQDKIIEFRGGLTVLEARVLWYIVGKFFVATLSDDYDRDGWDGPPSLSVIADDVGTDCRNVARAIKRAVDLGLLHVEPGNEIGPVYRLVFPRPDGEPFTVEIKSGTWPTPDELIVAAGGGGSVSEGSPS
jgi:hypothetical protein